MRFFVVALTVSLVAASPRSADAAPFTFDFTVTWDAPSVRLGSASVFSFIVDNGQTTPFNQVYAFNDVRLVSIDAEPYGGTYNDSPGCCFLPNVSTFFTVNDAGVAAMNFGAAGGGVLRIGPVDAGRFVFPEEIYIDFDSDLIRFIHLDIIQRENPPHDIGGGFSGRATITSPVLPGTLREESPISIAEPSTVLMLALGVAAVWRGRSIRRR